MRPVVLAVVSAALACATLATGARAQVPDPGGDENAEVPVPPPNGKYFGLNGANGSHRGLSSEDLANLTATAGANAIRGVLNWQSVEPQRNRWSASTWRQADQFYASARAAGLTPILVLGNAPWWARGLIGKLCLSNDFCAFPPRPAMNGEWAEFAAEAARRYPDAIFEVWNEPNLLRHWQSGPDPRRYAQLQVAAYDAIKGVNPQATVLSAGFANLARSNLLDRLLGRIGMREFVQKAYGAGSSIKGHVDGLAFHPYAGESGGLLPDLGSGSGFARGFAEIRAVRDAAGDSELPLFVTETGISAADGVARAEQATATMRIYRKTLTMDDVAGVVFHRIHEPLNLVLNRRELGYAWLRAGPYPPAPWPVYCTFVAAAGNSYPRC